MKLLAIIEDCANGSAQSQQSTVSIVAIAIKISLAPRLRAMRFSTTPVSRQ